MGVKSFDKANPTVKQIEIYQDFSGGINTELSDNMMKDNQFRELVNFDLDQAGTLKKRPGLYEIPGIQELFTKKLQDVFQDDTNQISTLKIIDCVEFFDGIHWVFNYITNKGLFSLILSDKMTIIKPDLSDPFKYVLYYPDILENIKIAPYSDYFICITSIYSKAAFTDEDKKQVKIYSWNPIPKPIDIGNNEFIEKGWVEASTTKDSIEDTFYGNSEEISFNSISSFNVFDEFNSKVIIGFKDKFPTSVVQKLKMIDFGVEYIKSSSFSSFKLTYLENGFKKEETIVLQPSAGGTLNDSEIDQMYIRFHPENKDIFTLSVVSLARQIDYNVVFTIDSNYKLSWKLPTAEQQKPIIPMGAIHGNPTASTRARNFYQLQGWEGRLIGYKPYESDTFMSKIELKCSPYSLNLNDSKEGNYTRDYYDSVQPKTERLAYFDATIKGGEYTLSDKINNFKCVELTNNKALWGDFTRYDTSDTKYFQHLFSDLFNFNNDPFLYHIELQRRYISSIYPNPSLLWRSRIWLFNGFSPTSVKRSVGQSYYAPRTLSPSSAIKTSVISSINGNQTAGTSGVGEIAQYETYSTFMEDNYAENFRHHKFLNDEQSVLFAHSLAEIIVKEPGSSLTIKKEIYTGGLISNSLKYYAPSLNNLPDISLLYNGVGDDLESSLNVSVFTLLDEVELKKLYNLISLGQAYDLSLVWQFKDMFDRAYTSESVLRIDEIVKFIRYIQEDANPTFTIKSVVFNVNQSNQLNYQYYRIYYTPKGNSPILFMDLKDIIGDIKIDFNSVINTLKATFNYAYYPDGLFDRVVSFKQMLYIKPNLADLNYLWYNLVLFNNFKETANPDIFNQGLYKYISPDLIEYPTTEVISSAPISLHGIVPVNNVLLQPGDNQLFQVFFNVRPTNEEGKTPFDNLTCHIESISVEDYNSKITATDFDTVKSLDWKLWKDTFTDDENKLLPKDYLDRTILKKLNIPSTTTPYTIILQVGERVDKPEGDKEDPNADKEAWDLYEKFKPKVETITRISINMYPQSSATTKISSVALFDEFTVTNSIVPYNTALVAYGDSNKLFLSDIAIPSYFPLSSVLQLKTPEKITSAKMFQNKLIISTENSRHYLSGSSFDADNPEDRYSIKEISTDTGVWAPKSDVPFGDKMIFLDETGIKALKNLYGTTDKEFTYVDIDSTIKSVIPKDITFNNKLANAVSYKGKYYLNFPESNIILIYNGTYNSWTLYHSPLMKFSKMFVNDGELYGIHRTNFNIYKFDDKVLVDGWNEVKGFEEIKSKDGATFLIQKGTPIICEFKTKNLDQNYTPHAKKYDYALLNVAIDGVSSPIVPKVYIDGENLLNYNSVIIDDNGHLKYQEIDVDDMFIRNDAKLDFSSIIDMSRLGKNKEAFYNIPIRRTGNNVAFSFRYSAASTLEVNSLSIRFALRAVRRNRRGIS